MNSSKIPNRSRNQDDRWEMGSEFHLSDIDTCSVLQFPAGARWYSLGRHAIGALSQGTRNKLWIPCYFCEEVTEWLRYYFDVQRYCDDPLHSEPQWRTLTPGKRDYVLAVNYFGIRSGRAWDEWRARNECVLVEDHTHDPFSRWACLSRSDYAFSSIRKTVPVPDGAVLWSPRGRPLPKQPPVQTGNGAAAKLTAMILKRTYLDGSAEPMTKAVFRHLQVTGESLLGGKRAVGPSHYASWYMRRGVPKVWFRRRTRNVRTIMKGVRHLVRPLFSGWPVGATPFGAVLLCEDANLRDRLREYLRNNNVFCPIHWEVLGRCEHSRLVSGRVLTIPADQRYSDCDIAILTSKLSGYNT